MSDQEPKKKLYVVNAFVQYGGYYGTGTTFEDALYELTKVVPCSHWHKIDPAKLSIRKCAEGVTTMGAAINAEPITDEEVAELRGRASEIIAEHVHLEAFAALEILNGYARVMKKVKPDKHARLERILDALEDVFYRE